MARFTIRELRVGGFVLMDDGNTMEDLEVEAVRLNLLDRIATALEAQPQRRDLFAAAALQGLLANPVIAQTVDRLSDGPAAAQRRVVGLAFEWADGMIAAS